MQTTVLRQRIILVFFLMFLGISLELLVGLNWIRDHLTDSYPFEAGRRFYKQRLESYLLPNAGKINLHVVLGIAMLVSGALQFSKRLRTRRPTLHRSIGYAYFSVGFLTASMGLYLSDKTMGGLQTQISNYITGALWMFAAGHALFSARKRAFVDHEHWVFRSYVIAASTALVRPMFVLIDAIIPGLGLDVLFQMASWVALVIGLMIWAFIPPGSLSGKSMMTQGRVP